ncbi:MAG: GTP 3',8-cyclase MoaA [Mycobacteriales bacterium]|nr:MAG: GTP 3',8-cyclase MoaA [Pseudonocardiales bacterium]
MSELTGHLIDGFGRVVTDLRVSLIDKCNLRCTYCMPAEGLPWLRPNELLTDEEMVRLVRVAVGLGVRTIRLTGGEPLVRASVPELIARLTALSPRPELSATTNGLLLARQAKALARAGLDRVNVSLDTLRPDRFAALTRRDRHHDVVAGLRAAADAGLTPVKVNSVLMRGVNDDEAVALLSWCLERGYQLRFIEQMPLDPQHGWDRAEMVTADEILAALRAEYELAADPTRGSAPAEVFRVLAGPGLPAGTTARVGVIASVTRPFCASCDRMRLTADGQLRNCLFAREESDLRTPLRSGASDQQLAERMMAAIAGKRAGHGIGEPDFVQPARPMSAIGG